MAILIQRYPVDLMAHGIERWDTDWLMHIMTYCKLEDDYEYLYKLSKL